MNATGYDLASTLPLCTTNPAKLLNATKHLGEFAIGAPANLVLFRFHPGDERLAIEKTIRAGKEIFTKVIENRVSSRNPVFLFIALTMTRIPDRGKILHSGCVRRIEAGHRLLSSPSIEHFTACALRSCGTETHIRWLFKICEMLMEIACLGTSSSRETTLLRIAACGRLHPMLRRETAVQSRNLRADR